MMNFKAAKFFQSNKKNIIKYSAAVIGVIFLLLGIILLSTAATRVVDNVIFGERSMFSSFLILVGILILITVFGRRYWYDTVLKKLNVEMESSKEKSKSEVKEKKPQSNTQKSNIEDENKSN
jgi:apolipoprotein N-acyltransferase